MQPYRKHLINCLWSHIPMYKRPADITEHLLPGAQKKMDTFTTIFLIVVLTKITILTIALWPVWKRPWLSYPLLLTFCVPFALCMSGTAKCPKFLQMVLYSIVVGSVSITLILLYFTPILSVWVFFRLKSMKRRLIYLPLALFDVWFMAAHANLAHHTT